MCLCTDDRNPLDIAEEGHLDHMIRRLIALGSPPLAVYRAASLSAAEAFGLKDRGLIAPGKRADIVAVDGLGVLRAQAVWAGGRAVTAEAFAARGTVRAGGAHSVKAPPVTPRPSARPPTARRPTSSASSRARSSPSTCTNASRSWMATSGPTRRATSCASR
jgi:adenine deaminase